MILYTTTDIKGQTDCVCDAGYSALPNRTCAACPPGAYKHLAGNFECTQVVSDSVRLQQPRDAVSTRLRDD